MKESKILIVDDDPLTCTLLAGWVQHRGAFATVADSTAGAEAALAQESFDLLFSDVHLPGNQQLRWVQQVLARDSAPVVVLMTGNPELESTLRAANLAVAGYLVKPLDLGALGDLCEEIVADRRHRRELLDLSRETARLLATSREPGQVDPTVREHLARLAHNLSLASRHPAPRGTIHAASNAPWRATLAEAIAVLEKTKHAFRSKDLGALRRRLEETLRHSEVPA
jgi:DNA-binding NtrC family response regulator